MAEDIEIKVLNAALDEREDGTIVLRGVIHPDCLQYLKVDDYQREILRPVTATRGKPSPVKTAVWSHAQLPDVDLGMRRRHEEAAQDLPHSRSQCRAHGCGRQRCHADPVQHDGGPSQQAAFQEPAASPQERQGGIICAT